MRINPIGNAQFVADIEDVDLQAISTDDFEKIYQAWLHFGVIRIRNQSLDDTALQQIQRAFWSTRRNTLRAHVETRPRENSKHLRDGFVQHSHQRQSYWRIG